MQFFTVFVEFFLVGLVTAGAIYPILEVLGLGATIVSLSGLDVTKVYLVGVCYVLGIAFHYLSRIVFGPEEERVIADVVTQHGHFSLLNKTKPGNLLHLLEPDGERRYRKLLRILRQGVSAESQSQHEFLREQDQLLRISRGLVIPASLTSITWLMLLCRNAFLAPEIGALTFELVVSVSSFALAMLLYLAFLRRTEDYHNNTIAAVVASSRRIAPTNDAGAIAGIPPMPGGYSAIVFDLDGTIIDSLPKNAEAWRYAANAEKSKLSHSQQSRLLGNLYDGMSGDKMFEGLYLDGATRLSLRKAKNAYYRRHMEGIRPFVNSRLSLETLHQRYRLGLATTSSREFVERVLADNGIVSLFDSIVTFDDIGGGKPDARFLTLASSQLACPLPDMLFVGDSLADWLTARTAGVDFALVCFDDRPLPDWATHVPVFRTPMGLTEYLLR